jgi:hypothetical protein
VNSPATNSCCSPTKLERLSAAVFHGTDFALDPDRVTVIPNAAPAAFRPVPREPAAAFVRRRFDLAAPFVLIAGDLQPRKNHLGLIAAFARLLRACPQLPHHLVL